MTSVKLRSIKGCLGLKSGYWEKVLLNPNSKVHRNYRLLFCKQDGTWFNITVHDELSQNLLKSFPVKAGLNIICCPAWILRKLCLTSLNGQKLLLAFANELFECVWLFPGAGTWKVKF